MSCSRTVLIAISMPHALIVDNNRQENSVLCDLLIAENFKCIVATTLKQARWQIALQQPDLVLTNLDLPDGSGLALFDTNEKIPIALMTGEPNVDTAVRALHAGVIDYLIKPLNARLIQRLLGRLAVHSEIRVESASASVSRLDPATAENSLLGTAPVMCSLRHQLDRVAPTNASVLLLGESGTGKELVAQTVHAQSPRSRQPFLPVNCGAISPQLIESEMFGHEKGSFTGADRQHKGYFERASGGTLFLDEVIEMPIELQVKLLRVLETGSFMRIGSNQELTTDVRIIAATNRDPIAAIEEGRLRLDLYHRLNVFPIKIPPLRERGEDIAMLAHYFLDEFNHASKASKVLTQQTLRALCDYPWPGNVRELRNFIQRAYILSDQVIDAAALLTGPMLTPAPAASTIPTLAIPVGASLADVDRQLIFATLVLCGGVKKRAADVLGISLKTLYNRLEEYSSSQKLSQHDPVIKPSLPLTLPGSVQHYRL